MKCICYILCVRCYYSFFNYNKHFWLFLLVSSVAAPVFECHSKFKNSLFKFVRCIVSLQAQLKQTVVCLCKLLMGVNGCVCCDLATSQSIVYYLCYIYIYVIRSTVGCDNSVSKTHVVILMTEGCLLIISAILVYPFQCALYIILYYVH